MVRTIYGRACVPEEELYSTICRPQIEIWRIPLICRPVTAPGDELRKLCQLRKLFRSGLFTDVL